MNETLKLLYDRFYTPLPMVGSEQEVETCHLIEQRSVDSFICGFRLAWEMANELNHFETNRHPSPEEEAEMDA